MIQGILFGTEEIINNNDRFLYIKNRINELKQNLSFSNKTCADLDFKNGNYTDRAMNIYDSLYKESLDQDNKLRRYVWKEFIAKQNIKDDYAIWQQISSILEMSIIQSRKVKAGLAIENIVSYFLNLENIHHKTRKNNKDISIVKSNGEEVFVSVKRSMRDRENDRDCLIQIFYDNPKINNKTWSLFNKNNAIVVIINKDSKNYVENKGCTMKIYNLDEGIQKVKTLL
jgi:hypothetical protein